MPRHTGLQNHYVIADPKVGEQHIYRKYSKSNRFQVTIELLNSENLNIAITHLAVGLDSQVTHHVVTMGKSS